MNEKNEAAPETGQPTGGVPQGVADEISSLAGEMARFERAAARGWKVTAVVFVILLAIIAGYLYALIYKPLKERLQPDSIVGLVVTQVDTLMADRGLPKISEGGLPTYVENYVKDEAPGWADTLAKEAVKQLPELRAAATKELKAQTPEFIENWLKPRLQKLEGDLPKIREELRQKVVAGAPEWANQAVTQLTTELFPQARETAVKFVSEKVDEVLDELDTGLQKAIQEVVIATKGDMDLLQGAALRDKIRPVIEEKMGPILDDITNRIAPRVAEAREATEALVDRAWEGKLSQTDRLELRAIQLMRELFMLLAEEEAAAGEGAEAPAEGAVGFFREAAPGEAETIEERDRRIGGEQARGAGVTRAEVDAATEETLEARDARVEEQMQDRGDRDVE